MKVTATNAPTACRTFVTHARDLLAANLAAIPGMDVVPLTLANRVRWTVLPAGGNCTFPPPHRGVASTEPMMCAELTVTVPGAGLNPLPLTVTFTAAETLDRIVR